MHTIYIYIYMNNELGQITTDHETIINTYVLNVESCNWREEILQRFVRVTTKFLRQPNRRFSDTWGLHITRKDNLFNFLLYEDEQFW